MAPAVSELEVDGVVFPPAVTRPPGSGNTHFLAGAGVRGMEIAGNFIKFTAIGVYLEEDAAVPSLAKTWAGKSADELLAGGGEFFRDVVTGEFEKFTRVTMILPLTGEQYSDKVTENCVKAWKAAGVYTDAEGAAAEKFKAAFKPHQFPPGSSILFTHSPSGVLTVAFSKDSSVPEEEDVAAAATIENRALCEAVLDSIIGEHGVSPAAKRSVAARLSELMKAGATGDVPPPPASAAAAVSA
uniref:Chalcone-flavonone isomerase family protein n=1 Tax=Leersia perrieri TaxID=77586 RepID=A0A0D9W0R8_9ORYZ